MLLFKWMVDDPLISAEERRRRERVQFEWLARVGTTAFVEQGLLLGVRDEAGAVVAAAAVLPPGASGTLTAWQRWWQGVGPAPVEKLAPEWGEGPSRKFACLSAHNGPVALAKRRCLAQPCLYLKFLGVQPRCQGRGHARALLQAICGLADAQRLPVSLLCETQQHRRLYGSFGFDVLETVQLSAEGCEGSVALLLMQRKSRE